MYRQYLLGREFVIRTDHSALQSLRKTPEPIGQHTRWQSFIEQFSFSIVHRLGTRHRNADALFRRPVVGEANGDEEKFCAAVSAHQKIDNQEEELKSMADLQLQDPDIGPILRLRLRQIEQPGPEEVLSESEAAKVMWGQWHALVLKDGILYRELNGNVDQDQRVTATPQ